MKRNAVRVFTLFMVVMLVLVAAIPANATSDSASALKAPKSADGVYIVQMMDAPVVAYTGGTRKYQATAPKQGQKIDPLSSAVVTYAGYLDSTHDRALTAVGGGKKIYDYRYSFNGFAAQLSEAQAAKIASVAGVVAVTPNEIQTIDTTSTPAFLGLNDTSDNLWTQLGGSALAGDGVIIGVIDTGIWPESLSFTDRTGENGNATKDGKLAYQQIPGWHGKCTPGEQFPASLCNQKLIGAQWFDQGFGGDAKAKAAMPWEFISARDFGGHGTHTSSTSGGNHGVPVTGPAAALFSTISGIAPHARIAMYKALWEVSPGQGSGYNIDLVAAIDQAVADGVDVINYSISGTLTNFADPVEISFMFAAQAGIFVAASAGNSGPASSTVAHVSPWITTVAAGTHNRSVTGMVTLGNGAGYTGASMSPAEVTAPLIDSTAAPAAGASTTAVSLCFSTAQNGGAPALDASKVAGKIVVCDRGGNARVDKSLAVLEAGGVGMILVNPSNNSLNADFHSVPTVHLQNTAYAAVHAYAATAGPTATISKAIIDYGTPAPYTASFSSRGPLRAGGGDLLKPDLIAPGQDILAAVAPPGNSGRSFDLYSGTSMSSPHVAGLAALLKDLHPDWTPMMIKSALMTTAYDVLDGPNSSPSVIFKQGAGHVDPNKAADPGLVYSSGWNDWLAFLCGTTKGVVSTATCSILAGRNYSFDPSNLNVASIAIGDLAGSQTVTRKVTNVSKTEATYTVSSTGMTGITVEVSPSSLTLFPGQTKTFTVTLTRTTAALNAYTGGQLTWTETGASGHHVVRIPMVVKPLALAAPAQVSSTDGKDVKYKVGFGYNGPFTATARGLIPATTYTGSVYTDPDGTFQPGPTPDNAMFEVTLPAGTTYARFSLFNSATNPPTSDLDLYVYNGAALVGYSAGSTSDEEVNFTYTAPRTTPLTLTVWVNGYGTANPSTFTLFTWVLGTTGQGNMTVSAPGTAVLGQSGDISLAFSGLTSGKKYLGSVAYDGAAGMPNPTIVRVDVP